MTEPTWGQRSWRAMGSTAEVVVFGSNSQDLVNWAVYEIDRLETCWSRFQPASELCELNRQAGTTVRVSETLWMALLAAKSAWSETGGLFDPSILSALVALGYDRTFSDVANQHEAIAAPAPAPGFGSVRVDHATKDVFVPKGTGLDLGGIGKGLAADMVVDGLIAQGARSVAVSMGGDIRVAGEGPHGDRAWLIPVHRPTDDVLIGTFPLVGEALVQSTTCFRTWTRSGQTLHHLIDPATGWPADTGLVSVIVTGPSAARSEAFAKAALIAGWSAGQALVEGADLDGWFIGSDGQVVGTSRVRDDLDPASPGGDQVGIAAGIVQDTTRHV
ncbi:MAG: FAD:protein FMN transferase [Actinomycetes bacterium]